MPRRSLYLVTGAVVVAGLAVALLAFPTSYSCLGDDDTFTVSQTFAVEVCATGDGPHEVVADLRLQSRLAIVAAALFVSTIMLRVASREPNDSPHAQAAAE